MQNMLINDEFNNLLNSEQKQYTFEDSPTPKKP